MDWQLQLCNIGSNSSHVAAAAKLAYSAILVRRLLLVALVIVLRGLLCQMISLLHVLMYGRIAKHDIGFHRGMAVAAQSLHGDRNSQRVAAE